MKDLARVQIDHASRLRDWLLENHGQDESVWLVTFKSHVAEKYVSVDEVLDELVAFDWIDGRRMKLDHDRTMQLISRRKTQHWSKTYKDRAARLISENRMHEAGFDGIERAKQNGGWTFMDDVDALIVPSDLEAALTASPPSLKHYEAFPPSAKRDILRWIKLAKKPETRLARINEAVSKARKNERASGTK